MKSICQDKEYSEDHDYYNCIQEFDRKDMLTLALYQEWVKRRYTKPTFYKTVGISIIGIFFASLALTYKFKDEHIPLIMMCINSLFLLGLAISALFKQKKDEDSEVNKLNAIRDAINKLTKENIHNN